MKIGIIGTGYVGLPTGVGLAELGNEVICIDREPSKIEALQSGKLTIYEDGLEDLFKKNVASGNIRFTTSMKEGVENADLVIIAVGTPPHPVTKEADMKCCGDRVGRAFAGIYRNCHKVYGSGRYRRRCGRFNSQEKSDCGF